MKYPAGTRTQVAAMSTAKTGYASCCWARLGYPLSNPLPNGMTLNYLHGPKHVTHCQQARNMSETFVVALKAWLPCASNFLGLKEI